MRSQFVGTCLLALKNGLVYKNVKETLNPKTGKKMAPEKVILKSIKEVADSRLLFFIMDRFEFEIIEDMDTEERLVLM